MHTGSFDPANNGVTTTGSGTESRILITKRKMYSSTTFSIRDLSPRFPDIVTIQAAYQGGKAAAKAINGNATGCGCDK